MTIEEVLKSEGYTDEEAQALIGNAKYAGTLKKMLDQAEAGETAFLKAQELEQSIRKFNDETVIPYGAKKDQEAAAARAEAAKYQTYLKSLKEAGYDIPEAYLGAPPEDPTKVAPPARDDSKFIGKDELDKQGRAYMSLLSMSEKARDLLGHGLDIEAEYDDFGKNRRPSETLRDYVSRKYDLTAKENERKEKQKTEYEEKLRKEGEERYAKLHPRSENEELRTPAATKFDKFEKLPDEKKNSWQTVAGRESSTRARQEKYRDFLVQ